MYAATVAPGTRHAVVGIGFTVLLLATFVFVVSLGDLSRPFNHPVVRVYLLAFGIYIVLALIERALPPAGPSKSFNDWLLNFQINIFTGSFFALGGVILGLLIKALNQHFRLGWIDLRFAHGHALVICCRDLSEISFTTGITAHGTRFPSSGKVTSSITWTPPWRQLRSAGRVGRKS